MRCTLYGFITDYVKDIFVEEILFDIREKLREVTQGKVWFSNQCQRLGTKNWKPGFHWWQSFKQKQWHKRCWSLPSQSCFSILHELFFSSSALMELAFLAVEASGGIVIDCMLFSADLAPPQPRSNSLKRSLSTVVLCYGTTFPIWLKERNLYES